MTYTVRITPLRVENVGFACTEPFCYVYAKVTFAGVTTAEKKVYTRGQPISKGTGMTIRFPYDEPALEFEVNADRFNKTKKRWSVLFGVQANNSNNNSTPRSVAQYNPISYTGDFSSNHETHESSNIQVNSPIGKGQRAKICFRVEASFSGGGGSGMGGGMGAGMGGAPASGGDMYGHPGHAHGHNPYAQQAPAQPHREPQQSRAAAQREREEQDMRRREAEFNRLPPHEQERLRREEAQQIGQASAMMGNMMGGMGLGNMMGGGGGAGGGGGGMAGRFGF